MLVADRRLCRVAQHKPAPLPQKARLFIRARQLRLARLAQPLEPARHLRQLLFRLRQRHRHAPAFLVVRRRARLLPAPHLPPQLGPLVAQLLLRIDAVPAGVGLHPRGVDHHSPQLPPPLLDNPLQHLRERVVDAPPVPPPKLRQRPVVRLRSRRQVAQPKVFFDALLQPPRARQPHPVGIQPHLQHQRRMVQRPAFLAVGRRELAQVQPLHRRVHEKTQMIAAQLIFHAGRQQVRLLRIVGQKSRHTSFSPISSVQNK